MVEQEIKRILESPDIGLRVRDIQELPGYYDVNRLVTHDEGKLIVKAVPAADEDKVRMNEDITSFLEKKGFDVSSHQYDRISSQDDSMIFMFLKYLEGVEVHQYGATFFNLARVGKFIGKVTSSLTEFSSDVPTDVGYIWNPRNYKKLTKVLEGLDQDTVEMVRDIVFRFRKEYNHNFLGIRQGIIHGDMKFGNTIIDGVNIGLIDFGDVMRAPYVADLANAMADVAQWGNDPRSNMNLVQYNFESEFKLNLSERKVLNNFIELRFATLIAVGESELAKGSNPYIQEQVRSARYALENLRK